MVSSIYLTYIPFTPIIILFFLINIQKVQVHIHRLKTHTDQTCAMWLTALMEKWHTRSSTPRRLSSNKEGRVTGTMFDPLSTASLPRKPCKLLSKVQQQQQNCRRSVSYAWIAQLSSSGSDRLDDRRSETGLLHLPEQGGSNKIVSMSIRKLIQFDFN